MDTEYHESPIRLAWGHWLSCGLNICLICAGTGELSLRYPAFFAVWLLLNVALAVWRLFRRPMWSIERQLLKPFVWLSPLLLLATGSPNGSVIARDADTSIHQYTKESFFGGPKDDELVTTHYRTRYWLYEEETGQQETERVGAGR